MGRKAKLKKARKIYSDQIEANQNNSDQFVQNLERQGYSLKNPKIAPNMPEKRINPQV
ncbi:MAG: hypothetical protein AAGF26_15030 [Cyanobacteria bacterium P01_G01_bin.49]